MSEVTVEGLEAQLEELAEIVTALTDKQDQRIEGLEQALTELRDGIGGLTSRRASGPGEEPHPRPWTARATPQQWSELADWVDWLHAHYQPQGEYRIPPCWPDHAGAAEELAGLQASWKAAMLAAEQSHDNGDQALYWHDRYLWDTLIRANRVIPNACRNTGHTSPRELPPTDRTGLPQVNGQPGAAPATW
ncbi:hypothetical protein LK07_24030 [Streptomyces pluripotens]|uniref:DUF4913 domain-containing protein n=1 Tax=Streptomyces pluripotens TaxID=1355015 RepID=A0A221P355_9ACTN|nr:hypothetical protein [Streptomyces pluripotens]ARP72324.1 hypothetical protein LK06_022865 [Streptomyces pluripotens]ASN26574.1 hypothetical protein LK07_24030 [Streptomyces pluripotens]